MGGAAARPPVPAPLAPAAPATGRDDAVLGTLLSGGSAAQAQAVGAAVAAAPAPPPAPPAPPAAGGRDDAVLGTLLAGGSAAQAQAVGAAVAATGGRDDAVVGTLLAGGSAAQAQAVGAAADTSVATIQNLSASDDEALTRLIGKDQLTSDDDALMTLMTGENDDAKLMRLVGHAPGEAPPMPPQLAKQDADTFSASRSNQNIRKH